MNFKKILIFCLCINMASASPSSEQEKTDEANGTKTSTEKTTDLDKQIKDENYISNITALGSAYATVGMMSYCTPYSTDVYLGAAAGILWVGAEVMSAMEYKKSAEQIEQDFIDKYNSKSENYDTQSESFKNLKRSYVDTQTAIEMKLKIQKVALMGYLGASVVAGITAYTNVFSRVPMTCDFTAATTTKKTPSKINLLLYTLNNFLIKKTFSATTPFWFVAGAGAVILSKVVATQKMQLKSMTIQPETRALAWLAIAGLLQASIKGNEAILNTINKNISKIDHINKNLQFMKNGGIGFKLSQKEYSVRRDVIKNNGVSLSSDPEEKIVCATSGAMGACQKIEGKLMPLMDFNGLPVAMKTLTNNIVKTSDSISGQNQISASALGAIDQQSAKNATISQALKKKTLELISANNKKYKHKGQDANGFASDMLKATQLILEKENVTPENMYRMMASYNPKEIGSKPESAGENLKNKSENFKSLSLQPSGPSEKQDENSFDFKFNEINSESIELGKNESYDSLQENQKSNQIADAEGRSLFEIISGRYKETGYKYFLEEEK